MKQSYLTDNIKAILALIVVILGISYFFMCSIRNIKPDPQILIAIVGSLGTVLGYFFGSSSTGNKPTSVLQTGDSPTANVPGVVAAETDAKTTSNTPNGA